MPRIVVGGAGAIGASIAYHLALAGADDVVLVDRDTVGSGATSKAMGGVRQQFSTEAEVRLAQESIRFFEELGSPYFDQVGYLFLATTEAGLAELEAHRQVQVGLGVPVQRLDPDAIAETAPGVTVADVVGGVFCAEDGVADPPAVTRELVRRAVELGVDLLERTALDEIEADVAVVACGPQSGEAAKRLGAEVPIRSLRRQLIETGPVPGLPEGLPMIVETETGFHFRQRGDRLILAMADARPRWGEEETVDESVLGDRLERLRARFPAVDDVEIARAWAGLYDMTSDAHPVIGWVGEGVYAACGFSGHGFMQSPAVGRAVAEELLNGHSGLDLTPYRPERLADGTGFEEEVVL
jgi:sarcosine oxidase, subunit beta